jgi:HPr kinase/phosphorylase
MTGSLPQTEATLIHATCLGFEGAGVLIIGPPGAGKSDLALRLIDQPGHGTSGRLWRAQLVADDQVRVRRDGFALIATAPDGLAGLIEVRGLGIVAAPAVVTARLALAVTLKPLARIERMPILAEQSFELLGLSLPRVDIDPAAASAPARLRAALDWVHRG